MIATVGFVLRFLQGASSACIQTSCFSIATNDYPEKKESVVGWLEGMVGIGLILGPLLGGALYARFGFAWTFYINGVFMIFMAGLAR